MNDRARGRAFRPVYFSSDIANGDGVGFYTDEERANARRYNSLLSEPYDWGPGGPPKGEPFVWPPKADRDLAVNGRYPDRGDA